MLWRCNNYKCMFHICHKHQPIIRIDMHCAGQGDRSYPTFGDRNKSTRAFRFVWRKHANWQFLLENVLLLFIIHICTLPPCGLQDGGQNIIFIMINWNESCVACIDIWPLFWQRIDHSTLSQCTLSDYLKSIFVFLYFCTFSHIPHLHVHLPPDIVTAHQ